jgi:drug/metabolite transporter (DMT)-like permease
MEYLGISLMVLCSMLNSAGQFMFRASVPQGEAFAGAALLSSAKFWGGMGIYVFAILLNVYAFRFGDLTILYPLSNLALVWNLMFARRLFGDRIGIRRVAATALIVVGCLVVVS